MLMVFCARVLRVGAAANSSLCLRDVDGKAARMGRFPDNRGFGHPLRAERRELPRHLAAQLTPNVHGGVGSRDRCNGSGRPTSAGRGSPASVPNRVPASISHPVMNPRYGLIARPTHSNDAPQFAFHRFSRR
jgi:hypothetical protein